VFTRGVFRVDAPDGEYIVRIAIGDASYREDNLWVTFGNDTLIKKTAGWGNLGNGYTLGEDTIEVSGGTGALFGVSGVPNGKICYLIMLSSQGIAMPDVADDGFTLPPTATAGNKPKCAGPALEAMPNPFNPAVNITLTGRPVSLRIYDAKGTLAADLSGKVRNGRATWNASGFASGVYMIVARQGKAVLTKKIIYSR
jgi:hypothetical protein